MAVTPPIPPIPGPPAGDSGQGKNEASSGASSISQADYDALKARLDAAESKRSELEKAEQKRKDDQLSEVDRLKKQLDDASAQSKEFQSRLEMAEMKHSFAVAAKEAGCVDVDVAFGLLDRAAVAVVDGQVKGLNKALASLKESKPYLFAQQATGSGGNTGVPPAAGKSFTPDQIRRMSPAEFEQLEKLVRSGQVKL